MDLSTIDMTALRRLPVYKVPPSYNIQRNSGNGCAGDPPGYPTYFTRSVYTMHGNHPPRGAQQVIMDGDTPRATQHEKDWDGCKNWDEYYAKCMKRLRRLWKPLPLDHPRTRAWIRSKYRHMKHCYRDPERVDSAGRPEMLILPVPAWKMPFSSMLGQEFDKVTGVAKFSAEYLNAENEARRIANENEMERVRRFATPENHLAVIGIREFYPEYKPELDLIESLPEEHEGFWWETEAERPTPENCKPRSVPDRHPADGGWCQWCGHGERRGRGKGEEAA